VPKFCDSKYKIDYICHGDVPRSSRPRQHIDFYAFKNSTWSPIATWKISKHDISNHLDPFQENFIIVLPSLSAIKCTVTDNKTINDKNCSLSIVLAAMDQKLQKS